MRPLAAATLAAWLAGASVLAAQPAAPTPPQQQQQQPQLNQLGFLPGGAKWAALPPGAAAAFELVDEASGRVVHRGPIGPARVWEASGQPVRLAEFGAFTQPGRYRLRVAGLPDSLPFAIAPDAYAALNAAALKAFYFNRAGTPLLAEHAGAWARPAGHPDTEVLVHPSAAGPGRPAGTRISAPRGWYDAGDYNKYIVNSGISVYTLLAAHEHFPAAFAAQRLGIPESGNALPDLLDEVAWNLAWMLAMQDPADGGVYHKLTNLGFDGTVMPHQATAPRYVVQKGTAATLDFAAVMAQAARVYQPHDAALAARLLAAARAAWAWAQRHPAVAYRQPADVHTGGYDDDQFADEFAWAAAELYITTRDDAFWHAMRPAATPMRVPGWGDVAGLAWISLAHHRERLTPAADRALIAERVAGLARELAGQWQASAWGVALRGPDHVWGSNAVALNQALVMLQGHRLTGERAMRDAAQAALDYVLGRNPLGLSMVTGFGARRAMHPHHRPSEADGVAEPVPGWLVGGAQPGQQDAAGCPVPYAAKAPALSYLDHYCSYASNEVAINWNAPLVYVSAALPALTPSPAPR